MKDILNIALAASCLPAAILGWLKYQKVSPLFHPFIWALWLAVVTEIFTRITHHAPLLWLFCLIANAYYVVNLVFFMLFFFRQKMLDIRTLVIIFIISAIIFIVNAMFKNPLTNLMGEKTVSYDFVLFFFGVKLLSNQIFNVRLKLGHNPLFFIAVGLLMLAFPILQNSIRIVVRYFFDITADKIISLQRIFEISNAVMYLLFFFAVFNIPTKQKQPAKT